VNRYGKPGFWTVLRQARWSDRRAMLKSRLWHCPKMRLENRLRDLWAVAQGACNRDTWDPETMSYCGGYSHWRCGRERAHYGLHRFRNYTWAGQGSRVEYNPIPVRSLSGIGIDMATAVPYNRLVRNRRAIDSRRRSRLRADHYEAERLLRSQ
jgi:hypothetical protein